MENTNLKQSIVGGYKKKDVISCLEKIELECNELKQRTEAEVAAVKNDYADLDKKYKELLIENAKLQKECDDYRQNKNLLAQLEIDANARAKEKIDIADKKAKEKIETADQKSKEIINKMHTDANDLREKYIIKAREEMMEIKKMQSQLDELVSMISQKNKITKDQISNLEKVIGVNNATAK